MLSGEQESVARLAREWELQGRKIKRLRVSHAFHSPRMEGMLDELTDIAAGLSFKEPEIPIVSNVTGEILNAEQICDPGYWAEQVRRTVRFADGVRCLHERGVRGFLEVGPDRVLSAMCHDCLADPEWWAGRSPARAGESPVTDAARDSSEGATLGNDREPLLTVVATSRGERSETTSLLSALSAIWVEGMPVDWSAMFTGSTAHRIELPTYAFQRERHWLNASGGVRNLASMGRIESEHPFLDAAIELDGGGVLLLTGRLSLKDHPWLGDHGVMDNVLLPGTAFLELALSAGEEVEAVRVEELMIDAPLSL